MELLGGQLFGVPAQPSLHAQFKNTNNLDYTQLAPRHILIDPAIGFYLLRDPESLPFPPPLATHLHHV